MDFIVEGRAFAGGEFVECAIGIENGRISRIGKTIEPSGGCRRISAKHILPAGVDAHVHFRDPGLTHKEDFATGTMSAAFGGISCVLDMPNTKPPAVTTEALAEKIEIAKRKACVDFGIYAGASAVGNVEALAKKCTAFKLYMAESTGGLNVPDSEIEGICAKIAKTGKALSIHTEDEKTRKKFEEKNLEDHLKSRSNICEAEAVKRVAALAPKLKNEIHLAHISAKESIEYLKNKPKNLTAEVAPHHLFLNAGMDLRQYGKVNPPLRTKQDQSALWEALNLGIIDMLASDHAPHTIDEKEKEFNDAPSGMPGVETMYPLMLAASKVKRIEIARLANAISERPAQIFGFGERKGKIAVGYDADLIFVDFQNARKIKAEDLHSKCGWTAFEKFDAIFPESTMVRGKFVVENGSFVGAPGYGRYVSE
ncbi:MAG: dihydroorotase [Candidatus Thermoplasmatota archaeon]|nr:dihydroorotase [Candidatus Thermoplasmatota archaeon]